MKTWSFYIIASILFFIFPSNHAFSQEAHPINFLLNIPIPKKIEFCGELLPMNHEDVLERLDLELVVILGSPVTTTLWFKRIPCYFPLIEEVIKELGLPDDLKYVALIESNLRSDAISPAGATGPWQFMQCTGESCGLQKSLYHDERKNWEKATKAALKYLSGLKNELGSWYLALAAYNAGIGRVKKAMDAQNENSFYDLSLPNETERYILRAIAAKLIIEHPEKYGINLDKARLFRPEGIVSTYLDIKRRSMPVKALAEASGISYRKFTKLNPEILSNYLPRGIYKIYIPAEAAEKFHATLSKWETIQPEVISQEAEKEEKNLIYIVKSGDTLSAIAAKLHARIDDIRSMNKLKASNDIKVGQKLIIKR